MGVLTPAPSKHRALVLTLAVFALQPMVLGGWLALIPMVKAALGLSKSDLALALLGMPVATIIALQIASRLIPRLGPRRIMLVMFPVQGAMFLLPLLADSRGALFLALMAAGAALAFMQVCLNVYAGRLEKETGANIMNRCHGLWALGLMAGSLILPLLLPLGAVPGLAVLALLAAGAGMAVARALPQIGAAPGSATPPRRALAALPRALLVISAMTLTVTMTEGAMADWAAVYMSERLPEGSTYVGIGVSIYAGCVALGRLMGDGIKARIGAVRMARGALLTAIAGLLLLAMPMPNGAALLGFAAVGLGVSVGFPLAVSAVAALDDAHEGPNIAIMSSIAICGFLIGPPVIGFLADALSLRWGLAALIPGLVLSLALCPYLAPLANARARA